MKSRRNFVVELKSSRRQTKPPNRSIWGDTDLKALASEVETNLPISHGVSGNSLTSEKKPAKQYQGKENRETLPSMDTPRNDKLPQRSPAPRILQALPQVAVEPEAKSAPKEIDRISTPLTLSSKGSDDETEKKQTTSVATKPQLTCPDELAELEAENRRLKVMFRSLLQAENHELRKMLARLP
ncbi:hypothetical protein [Roseibium sp. M-1]